ncbi:Aste57867_16305 [Aphanomyces stellatus]|uniref:Aste57867_16305 protein n=1 Tax=Aphanomyces stellatus TaxID=120398 RepID=A0A485L562_9STRA|nr:hypothetical protein As57867_016248 [Aphanomyces stellatus]VFT93081.1 Aste57867_16305 [Aphanomyces stellatus]
MEMNHLDMLLVEDDMRCLFDDHPMDIDILGDLPAFKDEFDLESNATTDECSPVSSPSSDYSDSTTSSPTHKVHTYPVATAYPWMPAVVPAALPMTQSTKIPFAMPIGFVPTTSMMNKRGLDDVVPPQAKRTKHEIRLMKNRESANKSRLRRKNQVTDLSVENAELKALLADRDSQLAARDATIKSLTEQLQFLRGLVTTGNSSTAVVAAAADVSPDATVAFDKSKLAAPAAGIVLCAFIFGLTLFSDPYANAAKAAPHRRTMRVVHGMSASPPTSSNLYMATTPMGMLYMMSEYGGLMENLWLSILSLLVVGLLCVLVMRKTQVHVNVNVTEKGSSGTVVHRLCHKASRWVTKSSSAKLGKLH